MGVQEPRELGKLNTRMRGRVVVRTAATTFTAPASPATVKRAITGQHEPCGHGMDEHEHPSIANSEKPRRQNRRLQERFCSVSQAPHSEAWVCWSAFLREQLSVRNGIQTIGKPHLAALSIGPTIYLDARWCFNLRMETVSPQEKDFLESYGWYSHLVFSKDDGQLRANYHTHGLPEHFGHLDFQFVLPLHRDTLHALATTLVDRVKNGERFVTGMRVSGVVKRHDVLLVETAETQNIRRRVLRVILPDDDGNLDKATLNGIFAAQFQELAD
jgi:hypothetical protein